MDADDTNVRRKLKAVSRMYQEVTLYDKDIQSMKDALAVAISTPNDDENERYYQERKIRDALEETVNARARSFSLLEKHIMIAKDVMENSENVDYSEMTKDLETLKLAEEMIAL